MGRSNRNKRQRNTPIVGVPTKDHVQVRRSGDMETDNQRKISWQMGAFDWDGPWGRASFDGRDISDLIVSHIRSFESMSWGELPEKQHHSIDVEKLNKCAQRRLADIQQDDIDQVFSLRVQGQHRIYGIKDGSFLKVLWYDLNHGDNDDCVCRSRKKHT